MLRNMHPDFEVQGITCRLGESAPRLGREEVEEAVQNLRQRLTDTYGKFERRELKQIDVLQPFVHYFKRFKKTYHLFLQLESFVHKRRPLPFITPLVTAYFLSELETGVLASAHDLDKIVPELSLEKSAGDETLTLLSGEERTAPRGDAILKDADGLLTSVIQGQDKRTLLGPKSRNAAYFVYGPPTVSDQALFDALDIIATHLRAWYGASVHIVTNEIG